MAKTKKMSKKKKIILIASVSAAVAAAGTGAFFFMRWKASTAMAAQMTKTVASAQVTAGSITNSVTGTGTLAEDDPEDISVPTGIKIDKILVESGDAVKEGQALATVDQTSVKTAIADIQTSISTVDAKIEAIGDSTEDETVTATVSGRVKQIYAASDDAVSDVMLQWGSLMVISADGKMAVDLNNSGALSTGASVTVTLSDGTEETGTVASAAGDTVTITLTDNGPKDGDTVSVKDSSGNAVGSGVLYVHQPYEVTGTSGTVSDIYVSENEAVSQGDSLLYLEDVTDSTDKDELLAEREDLTKAMSDMLALEKKGEITATAAGTIEDINVEEGTEVTKSSSSSTSSSSTTAAAGTTAAKTTKTAYETGAASGSGDVSGENASGENIASGSGTGSVSGFTYLAAGNTAASSGIDQESLSGFSTAMDSLAADSGTESSSDGSSRESLSTGSDSISLLAESTAASAADSSASSVKTTISGEIQVPLTSPVNGVRMTSVQLNAALAKAGIASYSAAVNASDSTKDTISWDQKGTTAEFTLTAANGYCFDGSSNNTLSISDSVGGTYSYTYYLSDTDGDGFYDSMKVTMVFGSTTSSSGTDSASSGSRSDSSSSNAGGSANSSAAQAENSQNANAASANAAAGTAAAGSSGTAAGTSGTGTAAGTTAGSSAGSSSGSTSSSSGISSSSDDLYSQYETTGFTVQTNKNMKISISVDELDILSVSKGQEAAITLDALENQSFTGEVTAISTTGSNSGGVTKFTVTITMPKEDDMLSGMSASASITISSADNVLTIPAAALQEAGGESYVYTSKSDDGTLSGKTTVETGLSNDSTVEITSGLTEGQTVYYKKSSGEDISSSDSSTSMGMMGGMGGGSGQMPSGGGQGGGQMPSGGGQGGPGGNG
jgi:multidrug efflux pump subunit AcrA (membrane-fusion protein)